MQAFVAGQYEEAARLQAQFCVFPAKWMQHGLTPTMKAAMDILGRSCGDPFPPYAPLQAEAKKALSDYLKTTDLMKKESHA